MARRDVRLIKESVWRVEVLTGGAEGTSKTWTFINEVAARAMVDGLLEAGGDGWRDLTDVSSRETATTSEPESPGQEQEPPPPISA